MQSKLYKKLVSRKKKTNLYIPGPWPCPPPKHRGKGALQAARARGIVAKLYATYVLRLEALDFQRELLAIDEQLFRMEEDRYRRVEISPGYFLKAKRSWLLKTQEMRDMEMELEVLRQEILEKCFRVGR